MPASVSKPQLSASEKLVLLFKALTILPLRLTYWTTRILLFATRKWYSFRFYAFCAFVNVVFITLSDRQIQARSPSTLEAYQLWITAKARKNRDSALQPLLKSNVQPLEETGGNILWIGNPAKAQKIVLFFHGGGFVAPALKGHYEWCWNAYVKAGREKGVDVAVACLHYTLLLEGRFPVPLQQAAAALNEVLATGVQPSDVVVGGDSAGANITSQLIGHILHPHTEVPQVDLGGEKLGGVFFVSPWLSNNTEMPSFHENNGRDMISRSALVSLGSSLYGAERSASLQAEVVKKIYSSANPYETPLDTDETWFDEIGNVAGKIYVTVGQNEVMRDHGLSLVKLLKQRKVTSEIRVEVAEREAHDFILLENEFRTGWDATGRMKAWYQTTIA